MNIKLKRGIFRCDIRAIGTFNVMGLNSNIGSTINNICFDTNFYSCTGPNINPERRAARPHPAKAGLCGEPVDIGSELEQ